MACSRCVSEETKSIHVTRVELDGFVAQTLFKGEEALKANDRIISVNGVDESLQLMARQLVKQTLNLVVYSY